MTDPAGLARELAEAGVAGLTIVWADNNGIPRSRTVPVQAVEATARRGVGATPLLAVFDTHDAITFAYEGLSTPSGDVRHLPVVDRAVPLAGQPSLAWAPSRVVDADGVPWALDPRGALEAQVAAAADHCCDALVLSLSGQGGRAYAETLLAAADFLAGDSLAPLPAAGLGTGSSLRRRCAMVLGGKLSSRLGWPGAVVVLALAALARQRQNRSRS